MRMLAVKIVLLTVLMGLALSCGGGAQPPPAPDFSVSVVSPFSSTSASLVQGSTSVPLTVAIEGDVYIIPGDYVSARGVVYGLHQLLRASDIFPPLGNVDTPAANATISGTNVQISGWAIDDTAVSGVSVFVDDVFKGNAVYGSSRPDVVTAYPHATAQCGWTFSLDSTQLANGAHAITIHATDTSNNEAILAPIPVTVSN